MPFLDVLKTSLYAIRKAKKRSKCKDLFFGLSISEFYSNKMASNAQQVNVMEEGNMNDEKYLFLSSKFLSNIASSFIKLMHFFHQNCLILRKN